MISIGKSIAEKIGVDRAVAFTVLTRLIQASGGLIALIFIAKFLSPNEQGYYYTFGSILAIQIFFELGLSGIITQYAAHEFAHLKWINTFELFGEEYHKSRLSSLLRFCVKWFAVIAIALFFALLFAGYHFFSHYNSTLHIEWEGPWIVLCLTTSLNLFIDPILAFFDGLGHVKDMARVRLWQKSLNVILLFVFFSLGFKLYSSALASLASICINYVQIIFSNRIKFLKVIWFSQREWTINYYKEVFPYQWRIAISWISGYFIFQLFNPVLFATEGARIAGQMGMTIAALTGIASISMSWINTKVPLLSALIAKQEFSSLDDNFKKVFFQSIFINLAFTIVFVLTIQIAKGLNIDIAKRFLNFIPFLCMCLASFANQIIFALATYLRCHKKEPMLLQSFVMGLLVCFSTLILGRNLGVIGIAASYVSLTFLVGLPWTIYIYYTKKLQWHNG